MLPTEFMARATWADVALLESYYAAVREARRKANEEAELMASADRNAHGAKAEL